jgi:hypothetical protein
MFEVLGHFNNGVYLQQVLAFFTHWFALFSGYLGVRS